MSKHLLWHNLLCSKNEWCSYVKEWMSYGKTWNQDSTCIRCYLLLLFSIAEMKIYSQLSRVFIYHINNIDFKFSWNFSSDTVNTIALLVSKLVFLDLWVFAPHAIKLASPHLKLMCCYVYFSMLQPLYSYFVGVVTDSSSFDPSKRLRTGGDYTHAGYPSPSPYPTPPPPALVWGAPG